MINNKVAVLLHNCSEDTVSTDKRLVNVEFCALEKAVTLLRLIHHLHRLLLKIVLLLRVH